MMDETALARARVQALYDRDPASQALGMVIEASGVGEATVSMTVRPDMCNGHATCHGGFIFALADSAFAFCCNSRNRVSVALSCSIDYLAPAYAGERLTAFAIESHRSGRTGLTEIVVRNQDDDAVARFRGRSYQKNEPVLEDHHD